ncbi:phosphate acyltransferase PlsX [Pacificimonas flava]|uniref:Phosphate acyltransferase n=1 Tax=Pacificimonas flava TaxID=1234595 RepID=M2T7C1_9SPHN|nr:phosphate acyltransferase PlsX [Pacificimonas flava]EMD82419.1 Phosphate:acyl-ACP acyltransferase PlsX [Pacificimonas flava]MBB5281253.1 glycerol-3-phosphate acyltransferase PlsX [Pacificimonas flava]
MVARPVIAIDVMGGDEGAPVTIAAADVARRRYPELSFLMFGDRATIDAALADFPQLKACSTVEHTDVEVKGTDKPSQVLRSARRSSIGLAVAAVKAGDADAAVSAGNTGALMALAKLGLKTMPGIDRPALAALLPTMKTDSVMLDLGANSECDDENLIQFAVMGAAFARIVLGLDHPKVGILNIGEEELKGTDDHKEAADALRLAGPSLGMQYEGFVEGDKIGRGDVDVIVSDGFSGNVALKTMEGTAKLIVELLRRAFRSSLFSIIGFIMSRRVLRQLRSHLDPNAHNGAVFLGLNGVVVKSHGSANVDGFANAIGVARDLVVDDIGNRIATDLARFEQHRALPEAAQ